MFKINLAGLSKILGGKKVKKLRLITALGIIMVSLTQIVSASSFDVVVNPTQITTKQGESIEVKVDLKDIEMKERGINTLEGYINFDEDVIENVEVETKNDWQIEYNKDSNSVLYGKFLMVKDIEGIKENEEILTLKIKVKDNEFITMVELDPIEHEKRISSKTVNTTVTMPEWLKNLADTKGINFSKLLQDSIKKELNLI